MSDKSNLTLNLLWVILVLSLLSLGLLYMHNKESSQEMMTQPISIIAGQQRLVSNNLVRNVGAAPTRRTTNTLSRAKRSAPITIPASAQEVVPGKVYWLGTAMDQGRVVEGYAIIHHKKNFAKPTGCKDDGKCQGWEDASCDDCQGAGGEPTSTCFGFLGKGGGVKWKAVENYMIDPDNSRGLTSTFISDRFTLDIGKWESAAGADILGSEIPNTGDGADFSSPDTKNEVLFGDIADPNTIALTVVWGVFRGPPSGRELVEWDQVYDDVTFDWSSSGEARKMDFENIVTHELGHSVGLDDLTKDSCSAETMFGTSANGEIKKRDLEAGDIAGVKKLYSP